MGAVRTCTPSREGNRPRTPVRPRGNAAAVVNSISTSQRAGLVCYLPCNGESFTVPNAFDAIPLATTRVRVVHFLLLKILVVERPHPQDPDLPHDDPLLAERQPCAPCWPRDQLRDQHFVAGAQGAGDCPAQGKNRASSCWRQRRRVPPEPRGMSRRVPGIPRSYGQTRVL